MAEVSPGALRGRPSRPRSSTVFARLRPSSTAAAYGISAAQATNLELAPRALCSAMSGPSILQDTESRVVGWQGLSSSLWSSAAVVRTLRRSRPRDIARPLELRDLEFVAGHELRCYLGRSSSWLVGFGGAVDGTSAQRLSLVISVRPLRLRQERFPHVPRRAQQGSLEPVTIFMIARHAHGPNIPSCRQSLLKVSECADGWVRDARPLIPDRPGEA